MRKKERKAVITFQNTTSAMAMEKLCKEKGISGRIIPVPRCITAGCGLAWSANPEVRFELENFMEENHIGYDQIYEIEI
ncbi:DUF3343 domain-containing protein [Lachnoclostridium phytofermentans]|uniref:Putative Se/S carrier protein-like domain-containing protein n=1 Tax=Lachnoclostridium phytofermentans (strain ATCC 700394 / DSM 18823 / ISDg) TaxID=357809 RepID=A9KPW5_LACP7|nr:DUF3343 domain-containing protein [Lachnoclostridium phytofermentans]ABX41864.1 hypothetical protein Cphy_1490 [Lachnoclostridium phytofermentans ISDg]